MPAFAAAHNGLPDAVRLQRKEPIEDCLCTNIVQ